MCFKNAHFNMLYLLDLQQLISPKHFNFSIHRTGIKTDLPCRISYNSTWPGTHSQWMLVTVIIIILTMVSCKMMFKLLSLLERPVWPFHISPAFSLLGGCPYLELLVISLNKPSCCSPPWLCFADVSPLLFPLLPFKHRLPSKTQLEFLVYIFWS